MLVAVSDVHGGHRARVGRLPFLVHCVHEQWQLPVAPVADAHPAADAAPSAIAMSEGMRFLVATGRRARRRGAAARRIGTRAAPAASAPAATHFALLGERD